MGCRVWRESDVWGVGYGECLWGGESAVCGGESVVWGMESYVWGVEWGYVV